MQMTAREVFHESETGYPTETIFRHDFKTGKHLSRQLQHGPPSYLLLSCIVIDDVHVYGALLLSNAIAEARIRD